MNFLKNTFGPIWLVFVFGWYIQYHEYYKNSLDFWAWMLILIGVWAVAFGLIAWMIRKKKTLTLTPIKVATVSFLLVLMTGMTIFTCIRPAVFKAPYQLIFLDDSVVMVNEGEPLVEGVTAMFTRGSVLMEWDKTKVLLPEPIQGLFIVKSIFEFGVGLGGKLLMVMGWWVFLSFLFYGVGAWAFRGKKWSTMNFFKSVGAGMGITMAGLFFLGLIGFMTPLAVKGWVVFLLIIGIRNSKSLAKNLRNSHIDLEFSKKNAWIIPIGMVLGIFLSLNIIDAITAFPQGFDSLSLYHNTPNLLLQYGHLIKGISSYNFELIIGLGVFLFKSATLGLQTTQWVNLLALGLLYKIIRLRFSWEESLALLTLFASLPMINFLMRIDLKIDLALFFYTLLGLYSVLEWKKSQGQEKEERKHLLWIGIWAGIAFGIKYTTVNILITLFAYFAFTFWGWTGLGAVSFLGLFVLSYMGFLLPLRSLNEEIKQLIILGWGLMGLGLTGWIFFKKRIKYKQVKSFVLVGGMVILLMVPWLLFNGIQSKSWSPKKWLTGVPETIKVSPNDFGVDGSQCSSVIKYSEVELYTGSEDESSLKMTANILWESTINSKLENNRITDIGFLFLGFALFALLAWPEIRKKDPHLDTIGIVTLLYGFLWLVTSNGIIWYGMPMFLGILLIYGKAWKTEKWTYVILVFWLLMALIFRFSDTINQNSGFLYAGNVTDDSIALEQAVPGGEAIKTILNTEEAKKKNVYLVGRFINYHIEQNDQRVFKDQRLDDFMCAFMDDDPQVTLDRLREKNFGYVIFMKDALGVEKDPNGPLHRQFDRFEVFAKNYLIQEVYRAGTRLYRIPE